MSNGGPPKKMPRLIGAAGALASNCWLMASLFRLWMTVLPPFASGTFAAFS